MTNFEFSLPDHQSHSNLDGLSKAVMDSLVNVKEASVEIATSIEPSKNKLENLPPDIRNWVKIELSSNKYNGILSWEKYNRYFKQPAPTTIEQIAADNPNFEKTITRLYEAKQILMASEETTTFGENIGDWMHLVLVPWEEFANHRHAFSFWLKELRHTQGLTTLPKTDFINHQILEAIYNDNRYLYRDYDSIFLLTVKDYLDKKLEVDGPWGVILMQSGANPGVMSQQDFNPDQLTHRGHAQTEVSGVPVGAAGIFEWLAQTLQYDPTKLQAKTASWLLASCIKHDGSNFTAFGSWNSGEVVTSLSLSDGHQEGLLPRLAVA